MSMSDVYIERCINPISLGPLEPCCKECPASQWPKKKENKMHKTFNEVTINTPEVTPTDQMQREYLIDRLYHVRSEKHEALLQKFYINPMPAPNTPQELADRLTKGMYTIKSLAKDANYKYDWNGWYYDLQWRDPAHPADKEGYDVAEGLMDKVYQDTKDAIMIKAPADGLTALQAFETNG